tara:strand:+ start:891 stop:1796 length:906 start_codon:yes stop_codon:yes gene_type:complete
VVEIPFELNINNLIDDLRIISWEASEILLHYSSLLKEGRNTKNFMQSKLGEDPVTLADLKVNELIIKRINEKYDKTNWGILSEENYKLDSEILQRKFDWEWILDPLDGTKDFIQGTGNYAMHLALNYKNRPYLGIVLIPEKDELWISDGKNLKCEKRNGSIYKLFEKPRSKNINQMTFVCSKNHRNKILEGLVEKMNFKKVNIMGSIGCKIASIIRGESDIYISLSLAGQSAPKDWDFAAPEAILRASGGAITNLDNEDLIYNQKKFEQKGIIIATSNRETHAMKCSQVKEIIRKYNLFSY